MAFDPPEIETDVDAVTDEVLDGMAAAMPGWIPVEGNPEVALGEEVGRESALLRIRVVESLTYAAAAFGQTVFGVPVDFGDRASLAVTFTVTGAGVEVPAGFVVVGTTDLGVDVAFELPAPLVSTGTSLPAVVLATLPGTYANGVPIGDLRLASADADVVAATATGASAGGSEPETEASYLDRLVDYVATLRPGGVTADDLEALARSVPGVQRALAYDLYDSTTDTSGQEKTVSIAALDAAGLDVTGSVLTELTATLQGAREVNFLIRIAAASTSAIAVDVDAVAAPGFDTTDVEDGIRAALAGYLSRASWGTVLGDPETWEETLIVRYLDVGRVVGNVPGVASVTNLTLNGAGNDVTMTGKWKLAVFTETGITVT